MRLKLYTIFFLVFALNTFAQVTTIPEFPTDQDSIIVIFDASKGGGGLKGHTGDVYTHTGVITNLSGGQWAHVIGSWGNNSTQPKLTRIGTDLYRLVIGNPRSFYNITDPNEKIINLAFVFRAASGSPQTEDLFVPIFEAGLNVSITAPAENPNFVNLNDTVTIKASAVHSVKLQIFIDNELVAQTTDSTVTFSMVAQDYGKKRIKAAATGADNAVKYDSAYFVVNAPVQTAPIPTGIKYGINYISATSVVLNLYAPGKDFIYVIGDFNGWEVDPAYYMKKSPDQSKWWLQIDGLTPNKEYIFQYLVDGTLRIADPYSEKVSDPWNDQHIPDAVYPGLIDYPKDKTTEPATVLETNQQPYQWKVTDFQKPKKTDLVVYELLLRDFLAAHDYKTLIDTLSYLKTLGVNAIELMPVMEFEGNESWGYNPSFHMAPDKYYGPKNELKRFIDTAHSMGMAVILDMVLNHAYGQNPMVRLYWDAALNRPAANSPWFNPSPTHEYNVGYDFNHESQATKVYVDNVNRFWLEEYNFDGFRFDLSKGFTQRYSIGNVEYWGQYDQSRINILKRMADEIWKTDSTAWVILEHFADNSEEKVLSDYGMMLWGNLNHDYTEAAMGYSSNLSWGSYKARGWSEPNLVTYMESHDEERMMFKNLQYGAASGDYNVKNFPIAIQRVKLASAFFFTIPGPKMIWQFGELGYDYSIDYDCRVCNKPIKWEYQNDPHRKNLYKVMSALIDLKVNYPVFESSDYTLEVSGFVKRIAINDTSMNVVVVGNFGTTPQSAYPNFNTQGYWYNFFSGDSIHSTTGQIQLAPGEFRLYSTKKLPAPEPDILSGIEGEYAGTVTEFALEQNYPNPFNPSTGIVYKVAEPGMVSIKIFDVLGREVKTLVNEFKQNGAYTAVWHGDTNSGAQAVSGVYIYKLETPTFSQSRKMTLIK